MARRQMDPASFLDGADSATIEWWKTRQEIPLSLKICGAADVRPHGICWLMAESRGHQREAVMIFEEVSFDVFKRVDVALRVLQSDFRIDREQGMGFLLFCHVYSLEQQSPMTSRVLPSQALLPVVDRPIHERLTAASPRFQLSSLLDTWSDLKPSYSGVAGIAPERFGEFDYFYLPPLLSDRGRLSEGSTPVMIETASVEKFALSGQIEGAVEERPNSQGVAGCERYNSLTKDGASWKLVFEGVEYEGIGHVTGMQYVAECLSMSEGEGLDPANMMHRAGQRPSEEGSVSSDDFEMAVGEGLTVVAGFDRADAPDATAVNQYGACLEKIEKERGEIRAAISERPGNEVSEAERLRIETLDDQKNQLKCQLLAAAKRRHGGPTDSGARKRNVAAVWSAIQIALRRIGVQDKGKFKTYFKTRVRRESFKFWCKSNRDDPKEWVVRFGQGRDSGP